MDGNANVFKFQGSKMIVSGKGPNFSMNTSFRPNLLSSTMNMPRNFVKQSSAASVASSQRSIYHGRDTSPSASTRSDLQPRNFHQPFYSRGYSQRSAYNDRAISPVSMRSIDSTASRADIALDIINSCTEDEWEKIWHAVNRKNEFRKKAQKRKKIKMFLKNIRNRSDDEGEQGSRSSISNDDCASTRTGYSRRYRYDPYCKENMPRHVNSYDCRSEDMYRSSSRDAYSGFTRSDLRNPYQIENSAYCPGNILPYQKHPKLGPMYFSQQSGLPQKESTLQSQNNTICGPKNPFSQRNANGQSNISWFQRNTLNASICSTKSMQNMTMMSQRDRFRGGFQFPSQKFNRLRGAVYEEQEPVRNKQFPKKDCANMEKIHRDQINEQSDENDDIFLDTTAKPKTVTKKSQKRKAESLNDIPNPTKKKPKTTSSNEKNKANEQQTQKNDNNENNEFEFVKPQFPVRKSAPAKPREKFISKSSGAPDLFCNTEDKNLKPQSVQAPSPEPDPEPEQQENSELTTSNLSMRPSFLKRKLFTQTLDVTERKNNSFDSSSADSPQNNIYSALSKEKHKTRKLVTSQSLLSRDVNQDDDNLLDLIHKIVPPNQVNSTMAVNNSKPRVSGTKNDDNKWDITSIISTFNNDSVSETYTDDEIFKVGNDDSKSKQQEKPVTKKNKQDEQNKLVKPESKKTDNNINLIKNKNIKDIVDINTKNSKHVGNVNPASNKIVSHTNNDITADVGNTKIINTKNTRDIGETKQINNKICKDVGDAKLANNNVKDVVNMKTAKNKTVKDVANMKIARNKIVKENGKVKLTSNTIIKDGGVHSPNNKISKDASSNPISCKNAKEGNKHNTNNRNDKDIVKKVLPAAYKTDTPMKPCPAKRVMLSRRRVDAFWDTDVTDDSDAECAGARRDVALRPIQHHEDLHNHVASLRESEPGTQQTNRNPVLNPVVALQDIIKISKKQTSKKTANKTQPKTLKKADDNLQPEKNINNQKGTPNTSLRTRRQVNLSATLVSVNSSNLQDKENKPTIQKKQKTEKKEKLDKNSKTKPSTEISKSRNRKQDKSLIDNSKERVETPKNQRHSKITKPQKPVDHAKIDMNKVLRSRIVDLSSSFNSDKFELTMSRTRKSRTPSKRISFNKKHPTNTKIRNRATKS